MVRATLLVIIRAAAVASVAASSVAAVAEKYTRGFAPAAAFGVRQRKDGVVSKGLCALMCDATVSSSSEPAWCNAFSHFESNGTCLLGMLMHTQLREREQDVQVDHSPIEVNLASGRKYAGNALISYSAQENWQNVGFLSKQESCLPVRPPPLPHVMVQAGRSFVPVGGFAVVCSGQADGVSVKKCFIFSMWDRQQTQWNDSLELTHGRYGPACASTLTKMYVVGSPNYVESVDPASMTTEVLRVVGGDDDGQEVRLPDAYGTLRNYQCAAAVGDDRLIVSGGWNHFKEADGVARTSRLVYMLHIPTGRWRQLPSMNERRNSHSCGVVELAGESVFMVAGGNERTIHANDDQTLVWSQTFEVLNLDKLDKFELQSVTLPAGGIQPQGRLTNVGVDGAIMGVSRPNLFYLSQDLVVTVEELQDKDFGGTEVTDRALFDECLVT